RIDYLEIFDYCDPVAGSISSDIGIGRVVIGSGIDNRSDIGQSRFTTYLNDLPAEKVYRRGEFAITLERNTTVDSMNRKVWVDWNNDGDFTDSLELAAFEPSAKTLSFSATIQVPDFATPGYTTLRVGTSYGRDKNDPCGINPTGEFEDYPLLIAEDDIQPVITLLGNDTVWVEQWYQYLDAGATAMDNVDGNITPSIQVNNNVDSTIVDTYYVTYTV